MTIPDQIPRVVSTADGVATEYSYHFYAPDPSHVFVASNGALVTSGWQAVKTSDDDGYIKFNTAPASGVELTIYRSTPMTQETVWSNGEAFYADTITDAVDKLTMITQELRGGTVNVPGTVTSAQWASSARIASSATNAGSATRAGSATSAVYATSATVAQKAGSAVYHGPFEATRGGASGGYVYYGVSGGKVCVNGSNYEVASGQVSAVQGTEPTVYLVGSSAAGSAPTFSFTTTEPTSSAGQFYAPIANFVEGGAVQVQFGNIVDTSWGTGGGGDVNYASFAGVANNLVASAAEQIVSGAVNSAVETMGQVTVPTIKANAIGISIGTSGGEVRYTTAKTARTYDGHSWSPIDGDGPGLGGVIMGQISVPAGALSTYNVEYVTHTGGSGSVLVHSCTIFDPEVIDGTPYPARVFICIPVGPNTEFSITAYDGNGSTGELNFLPYSLT